MLWQKKYMHRCVHFRLHSMEVGDPFYEENKSCLDSLRAEKLRDLEIKHQGSF